MHVVATAGHVDHGKSTLVRALTGMEPDRWAEERRRGMTIDLGFAWCRLPSGEQVAFVDVPGHERFVPNMLAGVGPVPTALLVVAADEGWMPQSAEHLAALDALDVGSGLLVVTRADLADPGPAEAEARAALAGTSLAGVASIAVSAVTGEGLDGLRRALDELVASLPPARLDAPVRLWVDRVFTIRGAGTVVTGTLAAGTLRVGDTLLLRGAEVGVRGLQALGEPRSTVPAVARVAVNLRGVPRDGVERGDALLTPGEWWETELTDVRLRREASPFASRDPSSGGARFASGDPSSALVASAAPPFGSATPSRERLSLSLVLHIGSAAVPVRVRPLGGDTARLTLARRLPLHVGDRALLRDPGRHEVVAGMTVLDPAPPPLRRRGAAAHRARTLEEVAGSPDGADELRRRGVVSTAQLRAVGVTPPVAPTVAGWLVDPIRLAQLRSELRRLVERHDAVTPLDTGLPLQAARQALALPDARLLDLVVEPPLQLVAGRVVLASDGVPAALQPAYQRLTAHLRAEPFASPDAAQLAALGVTPTAAAALVRAGHLLRLAEGVVVLPDAVDQAVQRLAALPQPFTASQARQALGTSRRVALPLLAELDRRRVTRRLPDDTRELR